MHVNEIDFEKVCAIAREAGAAIMEIYAGEFNVELKGDKNRYEGRGTRDEESK